MQGESERQRSQRRRNADPEGNRAYQRAWYHAHKEQARLYYAEHREQKVAASVKWQIDNPERFQKRQFEYRQKNIEHLRARAREYSRTHKSENLKRLHLFNQRHPERRKEMGMRRRATMRAATVVQPKQIVAWLKALRKKPAVVCYYCRETIPTKKLHVDHVVAVSRGGEHSPANLAASCADCNMSKSARLIQEWKRPGQQILSL